jgi:toxin ParE1/3/4
MGRKIIITEPAIEDLREVVEYISKDNTEAAERTGTLLLQKCSRFSEFPSGGRVVPEFGKPHIREVMLPPYRIIYRISEDKIEVLRFWHGARGTPHIDISA